MNNLLGAIGIGGMFGAVIAIAILAMMSYNENRFIQRINAEQEQLHKTRMKKIDEILQLLENTDNTIDKIETKLEK